MSLFSNTDLDHYLDEALPPEKMAAIEAALRTDADLARQLATVNSRRDASHHSVAAIWRRYRVTCPNREQLGTYLLGVMPEDVAGYIRFHLDAVGCRYCRANLMDLERQQAESPAAAATRQRRYFQSSAGFLRP